MNQNEISHTKLENITRKISKTSCCRFCNSELKYSFVDLGMSPICNDMIKPENSNEMEPFYPLHCYVCHKCYLVQLEEFVSPDSIFDDYTYFSSYSTSWLEHSKRYTELMIENFGINENSLVTELASNDGYLLQYFVEKNIPVLGVEPAFNVAEIARAKGIRTEVLFFGRETASSLAEKYGKADLLLGNNVLAHVPNINDFVGGMKIMLKPDGLITMEFPHLQRLIEENQFDTIYHEHFSYFSFVVVNRIFAYHGLTLFDVEELPTHGGALRIYACHIEDDTKPITTRALNLLQREKELGFETLEFYSRFEIQVKQTKYKLLNFLIDAKREGKTIVGYGAPGKGNTLLNYCGIRRDFLDYTVDRNPHKSGLLLPGSHIPVYTPEKIDETKPDYVLILPWNLKDEITKQLSHISDWGGQFIVPIPEAKILQQEAISAPANGLHMNLKN